MPADCSEIASVVYDLTTELAREQDVNTFEDVLDKLEKSHPELMREDIADHIAEAHSRPSEDGEWFA
jgi:hypothetical protein